MHSHECDLQVTWRGFTLPMSEFVVTVYAPEAQENMPDLDNQTRKLCWCFS